jgi:hypothetical protein
MCEGFCQEKSKNTWWKRTEFKVLPSSHLHVVNNFVCPLAEWFWMRLTFKLVDFEQRRVILYNESEPHPVNCLCKNYICLGHIWNRAD